VPRLTSLEDTFSRDALLGSERVSSESQPVSQLKDHVGLAHAVVPSLCGRAISVDTSERSGGLVAATARGAGRVVVGRGEAGGVESWTTTECPVGASDVACSAAGMLAEGTAPSKAGWREDMLTRQLQAGYYRREEKRGGGGDTGKNFKAGDGKSQRGARTTFWVCLSPGGVTSRPCAL